jgi:hypothetical protein
MQVSLHYTGLVVRADQGAPKTEGGTPILETEIRVERADLSVHIQRLSSVGCADQTWSAANNQKN